MAKIYINGASAISIQPSFARNSGKNFSEDFSKDFVQYRQAYVPAIEADYSTYIPPAAARRMSRIIKRAVSVSQEALQEAGLLCPDAIIFGTGLGCIEDTEKFLNAVIDQEEQFLQPAFFIQSTHNTIASQVAIRLACRGYNNTHVQRRLSFESALLDAVTLLEQGRAENALIGGHDEITPSYFRLLEKAGYYSFDKDSGLGSFAGEGSACFVLGTQPVIETYAVLEGLSLPYTGSQHPSMEALALPFLAEYGLAPKDIATVITAYTDDAVGSAPYKDMGAFTAARHIRFKDFCGEYFTASAFGFWLAVNYLKHHDVGSSSPVLLHNHSQGKHHSLILLRHV